MPDILTTHYGPVEGPLGFPMKDKQARALDAILKALPKTDDYAYRKVALNKAPTEIMPGERSDVSWITTESPDRTHEVVLARGMNDSQFQQNPLVTLQHCYYIPPVGRSLWRKRVKDGEIAGVKAKTQYPTRPETWDSKDPWPPDKTLALIQAGLLQGKSIGFLPTRVHMPDDKELLKHGWKANEVTLVIDEWILLEYACVFLPANQDALVESVSKGSVDLPEEFRQVLGLDPKLFQPVAPPKPAKEEPALPLAVPSFVTLGEIEKAVQRKLDQINVEAVAQKTFQLACDRQRGRV